MSEEEKTREQRKEERSIWNDDNYSISEQLCDEILLREHWLGTR